MNKVILFIVATLLVFASSVSAADKIIVDGFNAWSKGGAVAAFTTWAKGGPLDGSKELMAQANQFGQVSTYYGGYVGFDIISEHAIGKNTKIVFSMLNLELGSLFGKFVLYKKADGTWIAPNFKFHTEPEAVWPSEVVFALKKP